ncbi:MAG: c-type cytochrome [Desulfobacterales bacterium]
MIRRILALGVFGAVVLVGAYTAITLYDRYMPAGRMWETPAVKPHDQPLDPMAEGVVPFSGGEAQLRATAARDLHPPYDRVDAEIIKKGKTAYGRFCAQCHGRHYDGMGTVGQSFSPLPTDLTIPQVQNMPEGEMFRSISYGTENGRQPPLHATIPPKQRWYVIAFVKSLEKQD